MFEDKKSIVYIIIGLVILFYFYKSKETFNNDNSSECYKLDTNMCSPDCCGSQWPVSFHINRDPRIKPGELGTKYISTNMSCTGKMGSGCICADKKQYDFLSSRGNNT